MRFVGHCVVVAVVSLSMVAAAQTAHHRAAARAPEASMQQMLAAANAERPLLKSIYQAPTAAAINAMHPRSRIGQMVWAAKQYEFNPRTGGAAVLAAMPRTSAEMETLRQFCAGDADLAGLQRYFYGAAVQSVTLNPASLPVVLRVGSAFNAAEFPESGTGGWYCSELAKVHAAMPQQYDRAVLQAPFADREYLGQCGAGS
jgi:hypothetical protein